MNESDNAYDDEFFEKISKNEVSARHVLEVLLRTVSPSSVIDVGCGTGAWLKALSDLHDCKTIGIDGAYVPENLRKLAASDFLEHDLMKPLPTQSRYDLAICLEVAEHLPKERATGFVRELTQLAPVVMFSAAIPGQGGTHHVNEQWQSYWQSLFAAEGFIAHDLIRPPLWHNEEVEFYYRQNLIVYAHRSESFPPADARDAILDVAHPHLIEDLEARLNASPEPARMQDLARDFPGAFGRFVRHHAARVRKRTTA